MVAAILIFSEINWRCGWDNFKINSSSYFKLDYFILTQRYNEVVYEYIECYVAIWEIYAYFYLNIWRSNITFLFQRFTIKQECIPVGCVPAARWPYAAVCFPGGGGGLVPGGLVLGGVWSGGGGGGVVSAPGGCLVQGGVSAPQGVWSEGSGPGGSAPGEGQLPGGLVLGGLLLGEWYPSMHWGRPTLVNRMNDRQV